MSDRANRSARWLAPEMLARATIVDDLGPVPFVTTETAARYLCLSPHSLECYRAGGYRPPYYKFGKSVRYALSDLEDWIGRQRRSGDA